MWYKNKSFLFFFIALCTTLNGISDLQNLSSFIKIKINIPKSTQFQRQSQTRTALVLLAKLVLIQVFRENYLEKFQK